MAISKLVLEAQAEVDLCKRLVVDLQAQLDDANLKLASAQDDLMVLQGAAVEQATRQGTVLKGL